MIDEILKYYLGQFPDEANDLRVLQKQLKKAETLNNRRNFHGHITGSGIVLSPDKTKILLIYHRLFNVWQQPGGHWEEDEANPKAAARRETIEETSTELATSLNVLSEHPLVPLDIDTHQVPARPTKDEPVHWHHDFRYVFVAKKLSISHQESEVSGAKWFELDDPAVSRIRSSIDKLYRLKFIKP